MASIHNILNVLNLAFRLILYHRGHVSAFSCPTSSLSRNGDMTFVVIITLRFFERIIQPHHGVNCYRHSCVDLFMDSSKYACGSHSISPGSNETLLRVWECWTIAYFTPHIHLIKIICSTRSILFLSIPLYNSLTKIIRSSTSLTQNQSPRWQTYLILSSCITEVGEIIIGDYLLQEEGDM